MTAKLMLEIADTPTSLASGLMFRKSLDVNTGMLFKFSDPIFASFWGKNTYIPLDIAFVDSENKIVGIKSITPMSTRIIYSEHPCIMAIETNAGYFANHQIEPGTQIEMETFNDKGQIAMTFKKNA